MQRYFVPDKQFELKEGRVWLQGEDAHHITHVMRMNISDLIVCANQQGDGFLCRISGIEGDKVCAAIESKLAEKPELPIQVVLAQGVPKGDKFDTIVEKGTECGAFSFIPFQAERSIARWPKEKIAKKKHRLAKIAKEAAEQSHRLHAPDVSVPQTAEELILLGQSFDWKIVAYEETAKQGVQDRLPRLLSKMNAGERLLAVIGPEGGISPQEAAAFKAGGFVFCGLGSRILRTETAPVYLLACISYHFELLN
ncbi:MAG: 16S rRNA (uracil(1498)-N(3))-methyltransferase [Sporolactobacillus sp.]